MRKQHKFGNADLINKNYSNATNLPVNLHAFCTDH